MQPGSPTVWLCLVPLVQPPFRGSAPCCPPRLPPCAAPAVSGAAVGSAPWGSPHLWAPGSQLQARG